MSENEKKIERIIYFFRQQEKSLNYDNLKLYINTATLIKKTLKPYIKKLSNAKFNIYTIETRMNLLKSFYKDNNIELNIDTLIEKGIIGFNDLSYEEKIKKSYETKNIDFSGFCRWMDDINLVDAPNSGFITDSIVLAHELSHYRDNNDNESRWFLTEAIADAEMFCFSDYLKEKGIDENEINFFLNDRLNYYYHVSEYASNTLKFYYLYYEYGTIDEETYNKCFQSDTYHCSYDEALDRVNYNEIVAYTKIPYLVASLISPYLFRKYKDNNNYLKKIDNLHYMLNKNNVNEILNYIGINQYEYEKMAKMLIEELDLFAKDLVEKDNIKTK